MRALPVLLALLLLPASAQAATVRAQSDECAAVTTCVAELKVTAAPGERNDLSLSADGDGIVVTDAGAPLVAERNCEQRDERTVRCALARPFEQVVVETGDGDDVLRTLGVSGATFAYLGEGRDRFAGGGSLVDVWGDAGDDELVAVGAAEARLTGVGGDDVLTSGGGDDELRGGPGRDRMTAGDGDDTLEAIDVVEGPFEPEVVADDVADGGAGRDTVSYYGRRLPVTVDLASPAPDGSAGESDVLRGIEDVRGGDGADTLNGDAGPNALRGEGGVDRLAGRDGDDVVLAGVALTLGVARPKQPERAAGGDGDDVVGARGGGPALLTGGDGDDRLHPGRSGAASCGDGADLVRVTSSVAPIARTCERWQARVGASSTGPRFARFPHPRRVAGAVRLTVPCPAGLDLPCALVLRVRTRHGVAVDRASAPAGARRTLVARLPAADRAGRVRARVTVRVERTGQTLTDGGGVIATLR